MVHEADHFLKYQFNSFYVSLSLFGRKLESRNFPWISLLMYLFPPCFSYLPQHCDNCRSIITVLAFGCKSRVCIVFRWICGVIMFLCWFTFVFWLFFACLFDGSSFLFTLFYSASCFFLLISHMAKLSHLCTNFNQYHSSFSSSLDHPFCDLQMKIAFISCVDLTHSLLMLVSKSFFLFGKFFTSPHTLSCTNARDCIWHTTRNCSIPTCSKWYKCYVILQFCSSTSITNSQFYMNCATVLRDKSNAWSVQQCYVIGNMWWVKSVDYATVLCDPYH